MSSGLLFSGNAPIRKVFFNKTQNSEGEVLDVHDVNNSKYSHGIYYGKHLGKTTHRDLTLSP